MVLTECVTFLTERIKSSTSARAGTPERSKSISTRIPARKLIRLFIINFSIMNYSKHCHFTTSENRITVSSFFKILKTSTPCLTIYYPLPLIVSEYTFVPSVTLTRLPRRSLHEKKTRLPVKSWAHFSRTDK